MTTQDARTHLRYSGWASRRLLDAALQLPAEQIERDLKVSHKGVLETLNHIHWADRVWLYRVLGQPMDEPDGSIEVAWPQIQRGWEEWSDSPAAADLERVISYKDMKGHAHQSALWQIVLHLVNHATLHRGQVMAMMRQLGVAPPPTDLIFYYRELQIR
ncbi:MAG TPA: DinB family protein [Bryobacteraceae bacterium]|nr:DinB family protein [Bryobacteraceae bacterium]